MSLTAWEQQALDSIRDGLAGSDPQLTALLTTFTRLASGEEMPAREEIPVGPRPRPRLADWWWAVLLLWLVITAVLITVALVLNHKSGSPATCAGPWPASCAHPAPG
jgi:hypothetical protein